MLVRSCCRLNTIFQPMRGRGSKCFEPVVERETSQSTAWRAMLSRRFLLPTRPQPPPSLSTLFRSLASFFLL